MPDFEPGKPPSYRPDKDARGTEAISGVDPFIMQADGKGWLYTPAGLVDGPMPAHYEPQESPFDNMLYSQQRNPVRKLMPREGNRYHPSGHIRPGRRPRGPALLSLVENYRLRAGIDEHTGVQGATK